MAAAFMAAEFLAAEFLAVGFLAVGCWLRLDGGFEGAATGGLPERYCIAWHRGIDFLPRRRRCGARGAWQRDQLTTIGQASAAVAGVGRRSLLPHQPTTAAPSKKSCNKMLALGAALGQ